MLFHNLIIVYNIQDCSIGNTMNSEVIFWWEFDFEHVWNGCIANITVRESVFWVVWYYVDPEVDPKMAHEAY